MMPRSAAPSFSRRCCSAAMKPRKMLPAPKWTQMGCSLVAAVMAAWSKAGSLTPSFSHSAFWLTREDAFICIMICSFCCCGGGWHTTARDVYSIPRDFLQENNADCLKNCENCGKIIATQKWLLPWGRSCRRRRLMRGELAAKSRLQGGSGKVGPHPASLRSDTYSPSGAMRHLPRTGGVCPGGEGFLGVTYVKLQSLHQAPDDDRAGL